MAKLLEALQFSDNPFANYSAENEPAIAEYFVRPPYYEYIRERGFTGKSAILFGARGAGKSATRLTLAKEAWTSSDEDRPLAVTFDDFSQVLKTGLDDANLGTFVAEIGYLVIEALLIWLATLSEEDRELRLGTLTDAEKALVVALVAKFYLSRPAYLRQVSVREPLRLLKQAWHKRAQLWMASRWDSIAGVVAKLAEAIGNKYAGTSADVDAGLASLLSADRAAWDDAHFARAIFSRLVDATRAFGFTGVVLLVDKADETHQTNNSSSATAKLLYPVLANTQLLEIDGLAWLFFLWDRVREEYSTTLPVRLDKIPNATINWDARFLEDLTVNRLRHFSNGTVLEFSKLCAEDVRAADRLEEVISMSMRSPRELIRILDTIVREHNETYAYLPEPPLLLEDSIDRGLDKYTVDALRRTYHATHLQQVAALNQLTFINRDVQNRFRINVQSARNRIRAWMDSGMLSQTGTRPVEGGGAGKPSHEYSVTDFRVVRVLERQLSLGDDLQVGLDVDVSPQAN